MSHSDRSINLHKGDDGVIQAATKQKGSAIVIAIFVIVALLGAGLVKILASSAESVAYEVIGTRAYAAAQTGAQWQLLEVFPHDTDTRTTCQSSITAPDFSNVEGLENCEATVTCNDDGEFDGTTYYIITSTGQCTVGGVITSRTVEIEARSL